MGSLLGIMWQILSSLTCAQDFLAHAASGPGGSWGIDRGLHERTKTECPPPCIQREDLDICNNKKKCNMNSTLIVI